MALGDNTSNDIPLGVGYDANGNAKSFVELSAISVTNVSATQYWGLPAGSDGTLSGLSDTRVSSTGDRKPLHGESLVYSAGYWTPCAVIAGGGGGGVSFPNGNTGDILYYQSNGTSVTSLSPTATPLNLATTGNLVTKQAETVQYAINTFIPLKGITNTYVSGPLVFVSNSPHFTTGFNASGPLVFTGAASFTERPTIGGTNFAIATDLNTYATNTTFYSTTATLLEKPSAGSNGDLLLYSTGNTTDTTGVTAFITDQNIVTTPDLSPYATTTSLATTTAYAEGVSAAVAASAAQVANAYQPLHVNLTELAALSLTRGDILYANAAGELVALGAAGNTGYTLKLVNNESGHPIPTWVFVE